MQSTPGPGHEPLTPREREVLALATAGMTNRQIADRLDISRNAVRYHLKEIHSKLGTGSSRGRLALFRDARGWLGGIGLAKAAGASAGVMGVAALTTVSAFGLLRAHDAADARDDGNEYCYGEAAMTPAPGFTGIVPTPRPPVCFDTRAEADAYEREMGIIRIENVPCVNVACPEPWRGGTPPAPSATVTR